MFIYIVYILVCIYSRLLISLSLSCPRTIPFGKHKFVFLCWWVYFVNKFIPIIYFSSRYNILWYLSVSVWFHIEYSLSLSVLLEKALVHCFLCCGGGNPLQCSCLENFMDRGVWWAAGHGVLKSWTRLSYFHFTVFPCIYVPHILYPFVCQWTFRLLPCFAWYKQCC